MLIAFFDAFCCRSKSREEEVLIQELTTDNGMKVENRGIH